MGTKGLLDSHLHITKIFLKRREEISNEPSRANGKPKYNNFSVAGKEKNQLNHQPSVSVMRTTGASLWRGSQSISQPIFYPALISTHVGLPPGWPTEIACSLRQPACSGPVTCSELQIDSCAVGPFAFDRKVAMIA